MRALLDTNTLLWALMDHPRLSKAAKALLGAAQTEPLVSAASVMEIFTKHRIGKLPEADGIVRDWDAIMAPPGYTFIEITAEHARLAGEWKIDHKDPFDRFLIAQAKIENVPIVSNEEAFDGFGIERLW